MHYPLKTLAILTLAGVVASPARSATGWQRGMPDNEASVAQRAARARQTPPAVRQAAPAKPAPVRKPAAADPAVPPDGDWPRTYTTPNAARLVLYQPQVESWPEQKEVTMYIAVSYLPKGAEKAVLGTIKVTSKSKVAVAERLVSFSEFKIAEANFPTAPKEQLRDIVEEIKTSVPLEERIIGLDRVLAMIDTSQIKPRNAEGVKADPPAVFYSEKPAVLVNLDGEPIWSPIDGSELRFAVNTNWDLFEHPPSSAYFLRVDGGWLVSTSVRGPWNHAGKLPASFSKLPDDGNWADVKAAVPGKPFAGGAAPVVYVSTVPAELILVTGAPRYQPVAKTGLLWVSNTESDIFRLRQDGPVFYLVSGRWFAAPHFSGPWTFATPTLPEDFKNIPLEHPRSRVLASVPGTRQAIEAVVLAQIPQTARVKRNEVKAPDVAYQGDPKFEAIETTKVARAVNTDKDILKVGDLYFMCFQGVWFRSATPNGPWAVADSVPQEVYQIPISPPAHNVTYVTVENSDDDEVEFVATAAYTGMMVAWGCTMWGNGWYYPPYYYPGHYPAYFPHYPSYGYGAWYNPWNGSYTRGGGVYGPYGGAGYAARYNPSTGTYSRGAVAYGPGGGRGAAEAWNPRTGTYGQTRQGRNVYGSWGATSVQRGDQWASTARVTSRATGTTTRVTEGSGGGAAVTRRGAEGAGGIARTGSGDVYAGRDGNVYRNDGGSWQKYDNGNWSSVDRPGARQEPAQRPERGLSSETRDRLNTDHAARAEGAQRTRDLGSVRSSGSRAGSTSRAGSYRPSGARAGGGRRR